MKRLLLFTALMITTVSITASITAYAATNHFCSGRTYRSQIMKVEISTSTPEPSTSPAPDSLLSVDDGELIGVEGEGEPTEEAPQVSTSPEPTATPTDLLPQETVDMDEVVGEAPVTMTTAEEEDGEETVPISTDDIEAAPAATEEEQINPDKPR